MEEYKGNRKRVREALEDAWQPTGPRAWTIGPGHSFASDTVQCVREAKHARTLPTSTASISVNAKRNLRRSVAVAVPFVEDMTSLAASAAMVWQHQDRLRRFRQLWNDVGYAQLHMGWATGPPLGLHGMGKFMHSAYGGHRHWNELPTPLQWHVTTDHPSRPSYYTYLQWLYQAAIGLFIEPPRKQEEAAASGPTALHTKWITDDGAECADFPIACGVFVLYHLHLTQLDLPRLIEDTEYPSARKDRQAVPSDPEAATAAAAVHATQTERYPVPVRMTAAQLARLQDAATRHRDVAAVLQRMADRRCFVVHAAAHPIPPVLLGSLLLHHEGVAAERAAAVLEGRGGSTMKKGRSAGARNAEWQRRVAGTKAQLDAFITNGEEAHPRYAAAVQYQRDTFAVPPQRPEV